MKSLHWNQLTPSVELTLWKVLLEMSKSIGFGFFSKPFQPGDNRNNQNWSVNNFRPTDFQSFVFGYRSRISSTVHSRRLTFRFELLTVYPVNFTIYGRVWTRKVKIIFLFACPLERPLECPKHQKVCGKRAFLGRSLFGRTLLLMSLFSSLI